MFDLISERDQIQFNGNQIISALQKQADEINQELAYKIAPITKELIELNNQLNSTTDEQSKS